MAFTIKLQTNNSEPNRVTKDLTDLLTLTGELKQECSILDPVILIACDLASVTGCNYMTIPAFGRKYFVNNIRSVRNGLVEFSAHVDVLATYEVAIKTNSAIIRKQENSPYWNLYLNDGSFRVYQNPLVLTRPFPSGFSTQQFVLAVAGS
jgi:hypothetical protein